MILTCKGLSPRALIHDQRVLNDLQRTMISCGRMIRLLARLLPPFLSRQLVSFSQSSGMAPVELADGK